MELATATDRRWWHDFAVQGIFWRRFVDWGAQHLPPIFHAPLIWFASVVCLVIARPARNAMLQNLSVILPGSSRLVNHFRILRVFANFGWALTDATLYKVQKPRFSYEFDGGKFLQELASAKGAVVLTAHMGNYDLAAALFAEKFKSEIRMVRAPEPDALAAQHVDLSLQQASAGAVRIGYSSDGTALAFDLLHALRNGEIISIQGDRVIGEVAREPVPFFRRKVFLPTGPFVLSLISETRIHPLFMVRTGYRKYKIIARQPIRCSQTEGGRDEQIARAIQTWAGTLEENVRTYWRQWYAFVPMFDVK